MCVCVRGKGSARDRRIEKGFIYAICRCSKRRRRSDASIVVYVTGYTYANALGCVAVEYMVCGREFVGTFSHIVSRNGYLCEHIYACVFAFIYGGRKCLRRKVAQIPDRMNNSFMNNQNLIRPKVYHQKQGKNNVGPASWLYLYSLRLYIYGNLRDMASAREGTAHISNRCADVCVQREFDLCANKG